MALLDAVQAVSSGSTAPDQPEPVGEREPVERARREHEPAQLGEHALAGGLRHARRPLRGEALASPASGAKPSSAAKRARRSGRSGSLS